MKTRNIIALLAALPIIAGFTGCKMLRLTAIGRYKTWMPVTSAVN